MDPYLDFYGRDDLYLMDGVHLSVKGRATLCDMLADAVKRATRSIKPVVPVRPCSKVKDGKSFADAARTPMSVAGNGRT